MLSPELTSVALGRRAFVVLLSAALIGSVGLCVYASQAADAFISYRTAVQISGWLWLVAVLLGFCARVPRNRRHLGEVTAAATAFFTGVAMLYLSHFQWSELPTAPAGPVASKSAPRVWNPAAGAPPILAWSPKSSAAAGGSAAVVARPPPLAWESPAQPMTVAAPLQIAAVPAVKEDACAAQTGLSRLFCEERTRLERCGARNDADPGCPSAIPASPAR